jgi:hypothetical protein
MHDFGFVDEGDKVECSVKYRNAGIENLVISEVKPSCDCTIALPSKMTLPPEEEGELKIIVDTADRRGPQHLTIFVSSNDPITSIAQLQVVGGVRSDKLTCSPRAVNFGKLRKGETAIRDIYVPHSSDMTSLNYSDVELQITKVTCDSPFVAAGSISQRPDEERPTYVIPLTIRPDAPVGELKAKVTIESTHPKEPKVEIPITATILSDIDIFPDQLFLGLVKKGKEATARITISTVGKSPLQIDKIDNPLTYLSIDLTSKTDGKEYILTATFKPDAPTGNIKSEIIIHTNNPDQPEIKVPVYALVEE